MPLPGLVPSEVQTSLFGDRQMHLAHLMLVRFKAPPEDIEWRRKLVSAVSFGPPQRDGKPAVSIAFTPAGLGRLGVTQGKLSTFAARFREGMRAQHQHLGEEVPTLAGTWVEGIGEIHALLVFYERAEGARLEDLLEEGKWSRAHQAWAVGANDLRSLPTELEKPSREGLQQPSKKELTRICEQFVPDLCEFLEPVAGHLVHHPLVPVPMDRPGAEERYWPIEYFGFREGPEPVKLLIPDTNEWDPKAEQYLLNSQRPLLHGGTYLVLRQLEQNVQAFWRAMEAASPGHAVAVAEQAVGRRLDGARLDDSVAGCPFHAHAARANPRVEADPLQNPTLLRRGFSYVDRDQRCGLMFMAANRDIENQFEFIQRNWIQRGNHVGQTSDNRDPVAGLGESRSSFRADVDGKSIATRFDTFVRLVWGEYFFMPSLPGLRLLCQVEAPKPAEVVLYTPMQSRPEREASLEEIQAWIDDPRAAREFWSSVPAEGGLRVRDHVFVADPEDVAEIFSTPIFSVGEYGRRMEPTTGPFFLGMDSDTQRYKAERRTASIVAETGRAGLEVRELARAAARGFVTGAAAKIALRRVEQPQAPATFPLAGTLAFVLDRLSAAWFGVPGPSNVALAGWGRDLAHYFFRFGPNVLDQNRARQAAWDYRAHVDRLVRQAEALPHVQEYQRLRDIIAAMRSELPDASLEDYARNLIGIITGSLGASLKLFLDGITFFALGQKAAGAFQWPTATADSYTSLFDQVIRGPLVHAKRGGPDALYRTYVGKTEHTLRATGTKIQPGERVVIWLGGGLQLAPAENRDVMFGLGAHHCPARWMGIALIDGLLQCLSELDGEVHAHADGPYFEFHGDSWLKLLPPRDAASAPASASSATSR